MKKTIYILTIICLSVGLIVNHFHWSVKFKNEEERVFLLQQQISKKESVEKENAVPFKREVQELILNDMKSEYKKSLDSNFVLQSIYMELEFIKIAMEEHWKETLVIQKGETKSLLSKKEENSTKEEQEKETTDLLKEQLSPTESAIQKIQKSRDILSKLNEREDFEIPKKYASVHSSSIETSEAALRYLNSELKYLTEDFPYDKVITNKNLFMSDYNESISELESKYQDLLDAKP